MQVPETKLFEQFVDRTLDEVALGLELDNSLPGSKKRKVRDALVRRARGDGASPRNAAQKVIEGRFMLGGDDASYLASGLACLWSTVGASGADAHPMALAPSSLYAPDAVNGIRQGLLKALEQRNADAQKEAPKQLPMLLRLLATVVDFVPDVPSATKKLLQKGVVSNASERLMVMTFLKNLKEIMTDASGSTEDPETSLARRILKSARAGSTASMERVMRIEEVERANAALTQKYKAKQAEWKATVDQQELEYREKIKQETTRLRDEFDRRTKWAEHDAINALNRKLDASLKDAMEKDDALLAKSKEVVDRQEELRKLQEDLTRSRSINERNREAFETQAEQLREQVAAKQAALAARDAALQEASDAMGETAAAWAAQVEAEQARDEAERARATAEAARAGQDDVRERLEEAVRTSRTLMAEAQQQRTEAATQLADAQEALRRCEEENLGVVQELGVVEQALAQKEAQLEVARQEKEAAAVEAGAAAAAAKRAADVARAQQLAELRTQMEALIDALKAEKDEQEANWKAEVEQLKSEAARKNAELAACLVEKTAQATQLENCAAEKEALREQLNGDMMKERAELDAQIAQLKQEQAANASVVTAELLQKLEAERAATDTAQAAIEEMDRQRREATKKAAAAREEVAALKAKMESELVKQSEDAATVAALQQAELQAKAEALQIAQDKVEELTKKTAKQSQELAEAKEAEEACVAKADTDLNDVLQNTQANMRLLLDAQREKFETMVDEIDGKIVAAQAAFQELKREGDANLSKERDRIKADQALNETEQKRVDLEAQEAHRQAMEKALAEMKSLIAESEKEKVEVMRLLLENKKAVAAIPPPTIPPPPPPPEPMKLVDDLDDKFDKELNKKEPADKSRPGKKITKTARERQRDRIKAQVRQLIAEEKDVTRQTSDCMDDECDLDDSFVPCAIIRGLVGQRAPTEPASATCAHDDLLPYALPELHEFVKRMVPVRTLLESSPDPTADELSDAEGAHAPKRQKLDMSESPAAIAEALEAFGDNFAIIGRTPVAELPAERHGVEKPHEVRWLPQGPRAETMARVAVMEHAIARCKQVAESSEAGEEATRALRRAGAALKFGQMQELYALNEAVEFDDSPHPLGTQARLVTRPCAQIRGTLSYPTDPGVQAISEDQVPEGDLNGSVALSNAMRGSAAETAALRNELRRKGLPSHFYVAPPAHRLAFAPAPQPTGADMDFPSVDVPDDDPTTPAPAKPKPKPKASSPPPAFPSADVPPDDSRSTPDGTPVDVVMGEPVPAAADAAQPATEQPAQLEQQSRSLWQWAKQKGQYAAASWDEYKENQAFRQKAARAAAQKSAAAASAQRASERLRPSDYSTETWSRVINRAIVAASALRFEGDKDDGKCADTTAAFLEMNKSTRDGAGEVTAQTRRDGLWTEMRRHVAISQDRLWIFIRLMSGGIGGDVQEVITMADAATLKAAKAIQDQRLEIAKRVSDMQAKIVETVVASMLKKSEMTMSLEDDNHLAVIDGDAKKKLDELASGASGRPFFEANVALKNLTEETNKAPPALKDVLSGLANVGAQLQGSLEQSLAEPGAASASLVELSHPSNSYFVSMRPDAVAAIRSAHERLNSELGVVGGRRRLALWELVEGGCQVLTHRFAELCGFLLVQTRTSTGVSAMYVSAQSIYTNASQARVALAKLVAAASAYIARVSAPVFDAPDSQAERWRVLAAGERVTDMSITAAPRSVAREPLFAPISNSGWVNIGGRRY